MRFISRNGFWVVGVIRYTLDYVAHCHALVFSATSVQSNFFKEVYFISNSTAFSYSDSTEAIDTQTNIINKNWST